jgi:hypothetical protein
MRAAWAAGRRRSVVLLFIEALFKRSTAICDQAALFNHQTRPDMRHCKGCSHPTICDTHGCGAEEARRNRAREAQQQASGQLNACAHELLAELITCRHDLARLLGELRESVTVPGTDEIPDPDDASLCEFEETRIARLDALIARATGGQAINSPQGGKS